MILFENVSKLFPDGTKAINDLTLEIKKGESVVFLGTSGSGKTTALKCLIRLLTPNFGKIWIEGQDHTHIDLLQLRKSIGYVFQQGACFDHMTVFDNLAVVLKLNKWPKDQILTRIKELLNLVKLDLKLLNRFPSELSGGQKQRVAFAIALVTDPPILLMDEPFSQLDPLTKEQLQNDFSDLVFQMKKTVIFVTHDLLEAIKLANKIAIFHEGKLQQFATPQEIVSRPKNDFVNQFLGPHRFQLILHTQTLKSQVERLKIKRKLVDNDDHLLMRHSLLEAMDFFKLNPTRQIPIFDGKEYRGHLTKENLMKTIQTIIKENV